MTEPARSRCAWIVAVAVAVVSAACNAWFRRGQVFGPLDDESLLVPIALKTCGAAAYPADRWLATVAPIFSLPYSWLVGALLRAIDDPVVALRWLAIPFHVVFLAGTWRVAERFAGLFAAVLAVALCALPPFGGQVLAPGAALPRDLVFALVPWFLLGVEDLRERPSRAALLFVALGVAANLHPLTALHAAIGLGLVLLFRAPFRTTLLCGAAFAVGALPYVFQYLGRPAQPGVVDDAVYAWRLGAMAGESWDTAASRLEPLVWLAAIAGVFVLAARRDGAAVPRWFAAAALGALVLAAVGPALGALWTPLRAFQFGRFERFAFWTLAIAAATGAASAGRARRFGAIAVAAALLAIAAFGPILLADAAGRGPIGRIVRRMVRRPGADPVPARPAGLVRREGAVDPTETASRDAFVAVCEFARGSSPPGALFLVPPENWGAFRAYARRGAFVTRKEGGAALSFLGAGGMDWFRDYAEAVRVFAAGGPGDWDALVARTGAAYVVVDAATGSPPAWPVAFEAGNFRVFAAPQK